METPCKILSYDNRVTLHDKLLDLYKLYNISIDFVRDMSDAALHIKQEEYQLMFVYAENQNTVSTLPVVRELSNIPFIVLSEKYDSTLKLHSIHSGADEYFQEPFNLHDGLLSALAQIRRYQEYSKKKAKPSLLVEDTLLLSIEQRKVFVCGEYVELTHYEYELLRFLFTNRTRAYSYEQIYDHVYNQPENGDSRTLIHNLTKRLRDRIQVEGTPKYIRNLPGYGYSFDPHL